MIAEIQAGYSSAKAAVEIVKGIQSLKTETAINQAVIDIQRLLLETQTSMMSANDLYTTSLKRIDALEAEIVQMKNWEADKHRYQLADTGQGSLAYSVKEGMENGEPPHWICPNCYQQDKKSIMKHDMLPVGRTDTLVCHPCGLEIITRGVRVSPPPRAGTFGRSR